MKERPHTLTDEDVAALRMGQRVTDAMGRTWVVSSAPHHDPLALPCWSVMVRCGKVWMRADRRNGLVLVEES